MSMPIGAQQPATLGAARVTLVAGPSPSKGGRTEVVRRAGRSPQNIVIVSTNANADDLAGALALVNALRVEYGDALVARLSRPARSHAPRPELEGQQLPEVAARTTGAAAQGAGAEPRRASVG